MNSVAPILEVNDLTVEYRVKTKGQRGVRIARAVDGVSLKIRPGETLAVVGESGSGKTSIANAIMRLIEPTSGSIMLDGKELTKLAGKELRLARSKFQMIFQDPFESLDPRRTVLDTILESLVVAGIGIDDAEKRKLALEALEKVGLIPAENVGARYTYQLSGGQRQRVAIAAAMILKPHLLVADEPVSMLDVSLRAGILRLMRELSSELQIATLFITHDLSLAWMYADRIAVVYSGRIVEEGHPADLISFPQHPYTKALVSVIPVPEKNIARNRIILSGEIPDPLEIPSGCRFSPRCPKYRALGQPELCISSDPKLESIGDQFVACHFPEKKETK